MAHPNEDLARKGYEAFMKADMQKVSDFFADDIVWHVGGRGRGAFLHGLTPSAISSPGPDPKLFSPEATPGGFRATGPARGHSARALRGWRRRRGARTGTPASKSGRPGGGPHIGQADGQFARRRGACRTQGRGMMPTPCSYLLDNRME
jgi:hypothetical protein